MPADKQDDDANPPPKSNGRFVKCDPRINRGKTKRGSSEKTIAAKIANEKLPAGDRRNSKRKEKSWLILLDVLQAQTLKPNNVRASKLFDKMIARLQKPVSDEPQYVMLSPDPLPEDQWEAESKRTLKLPS